MTVHRTRRGKKKSWHWVSRVSPDEFRPVVFVYLFEPLQSLVLLSLRMVLGLCALTTVTVKTSANCKLEVQRVQASFMSQFSKFLRRKKVQTNKNTKQKRGNHPKKQHTKRISSQLLVLQRVKGVKQHVVFQTGLLALFWNVEI